MTYQQQICAASAPTCGLASGGWTNSWCCHPCWSRFCYISCISHLLVLSQNVASICFSMAFSLSANHVGQWCVVSREPGLTSKIRLFNQVSRLSFPPSRLSPVFLLFPYIISLPIGAVRWVAVNYSTRSCRLLQQVSHLILTPPTNTHIPIQTHAKLRCIVGRRRGELINSTHCILAAGLAWLKNVNFRRRSFCDTATASKEFGKTLRVTNHDENSDFKRR